MEAGDKFDHQVYLVPPAGDGERGRVTRGKGGGIYVTVLTQGHSLKSQFDLKTLTNAMPNLLIYRID